MGKPRNVVSVLLVGVLLSVGSVVGGQALAPTPAAYAVSGDVTMAGIGSRVVPPGSHGDTWDSTWLANDRLLAQQNDGQGFGGAYVNDRITEITGTPETPSTIVGANLNPGALGSTLGNTYSTSVYEVDGALYHIVCYSDQTPGAFSFRNASLLKSTDGGATWLNTAGTSAIPADSSAASTFPASVWGEVNFVKYGRGGVAPNIDNAQTYAYLTNPNGVNNSDYYLARVKRSDLTNWVSTFDRTKIQYFSGGDGMLDSSWSSNISNATSIYNRPGRASATAVVYNAGLGRYIATPFSSDSFASPQIESSVRVLQSPHPWGPWTDVLDENVNTKQSDNLAWSYLTQKFTTADGKKMWMTASGRAPYGLQFLPVYLTTSPVQTLQGESGMQTGTNSSTSVLGYEGSGYVTGLDAIGDSLTLSPSVSETGAYIVKFRYHTTSSTSLSWSVNGARQASLPIGRSVQTYTTWTEMSIFAWLTAGSNAITFSVDPGDPGNVDIDSMSLAFYSAVPDSLPGARPGSGLSGGGPSVDDTSSAVTYSGAWSSNGNPNVGYYNDTFHYSNTPGAYAEYAFSGTSVSFYGSRNFDNGKADIYIDGVLDQTIDRYSPTTVKQQLLYSRAGLAPGSHTIRIVVRSDKNPASSNYYIDVDGFGD